MIPICVLTQHILLAGVGTYRVEREIAHHGIDRFEAATTAEPGVECTVRKPC